MAIIDQVHYSVCEDCLISIANGHNDNTSVAEDDHLEMRMRDELDGRKGHWVTGVEPTGSDPHGSGYDEFSSHSCELCNTHLAGSRHGITLLLEDDK